MSDTVMYWYSTSVEEILQEEALDVNVPAYFRTEEEVRAPFLNVNSPVRMAGLELVETKQQNLDCMVRRVHQRGMYRQGANNNLCCIGSLVQQRSAHILLSV